MNRTAKTERAEYNGADIIQVDDRYTIWLDTGVIYDSCGEDIPQYVIEIRDSTMKEAKQ